MKKVERNKNNIHSNFCVNSQERVAETSQTSQKLFQFNKVNKGKHKAVKSRLLLLKIQAVKKKRSQFTRAFQDRMKYDR